MRWFKELFDKSIDVGLEYKYRPNFEAMEAGNDILNAFGWVFNPNPEIAEEAANTVDRLFISQTELKSPSSYLSLRFIHLKNKDLKRFYDFDFDLQNSLFSIASINNDGYIREKALKFLIRNPVRSTVPFILIRLADWVPNIRTIAEEGVNNIIAKQDSYSLTYYHEIIDWLLKVKRVDLQAVHQVLIDHIFSESNIDQHLKSIAEIAERERYFIFKNLIYGYTQNRNIYQKALADKNHLIRLMALKNTDLSSQPKIFQRFLKDKSQRIRGFLISNLPESDLKTFSAELRYLLFDDSAVIRAKARALVAKFSDPDLPELYRAAAIESPSPGVIIGLSEVGDQNDFEIITKFLNSNSVKNRAASLVAIAILDINRAREIAFSLLHDESNRVKRSCVQIISKERSYDDLPKLRTIYNEGGNETKRFVLKAISAYGGWAIAGDFLIGLKESDEKLKDTACALLNNWYAYSISLGRKKVKEDKDYVMSVYSNIEKEKLQLPQNIQRIIDQIPFIFTHKS